jgi:amidophosphoribosyltransferase
MTDPDKAREACGVIGVYTNDPAALAARLVYLGLQALQHRGQEAAGIAAGDGQQIQTYKALGLVAQVFNDTTLQRLVGFTAIGHTRYTTSGTNSVENAQPLQTQTLHGPLALAHNGNLTNLSHLKQSLALQPADTPHHLLASDSYFMLEMLAQQAKRNKPWTWPEVLKAVMPHWKGAYSLTLTTQDTLMAVRDPWGFRPLHVGHLQYNKGYAVASETGALTLLGCHSLREIAPGEILLINQQGLQSFQGQHKMEPLASCTFEPIYFARPDNQWDGSNVHQIRQKLGILLAKEMQHIDADFVIPVPDSGIPAAIGFSQETGIPYNEGFIKNRYIGRTFIQPTEALRKQGVALKFNVLAENLRGKRIIIIDDSIVRGNTSGPLIQMARQAGTREIHLGITCPPIRYPCHMGVDMGNYETLIANKQTLEEMRRHFNCDSLHFLSLKSVMEALNNQPGYCNACFTGYYPIPLE